MEGKNPPKEETRLPEIGNSLPSTKQRKEGGWTEAFEPSERQPIGFILVNNEHETGKKSDSEEPARVQGLRLPPIQNVSCWELAKCADVRFNCEREASLRPRDTKVHSKVADTQRQASAPRNKLPPLISPALLTIHGTCTSAICPSSQIGEKEDKTSEEVFADDSTAAEPVWQQQEDDHHPIRTENDHDLTEVTGVVMEAAPLPVLNSPGCALADTCPDEPDFQNFSVTTARKFENSVNVMVYPGNAERACSSAKDSRKRSVSQDGRPKTSWSTFQSAETLLRKDDSCEEDLQSSNDFEQIEILNGTELADLDFTDDDIVDDFHGNSNYQHPSSSTLLRSLVDKHKEYFYSVVKTRSTSILPYNDELQLLLDGEKTVQINRQYIPDDCLRKSPSPTAVTHPNAIENEDKDQISDLFASKKSNSMETLTVPAPEAKSGTKQKLVKRQSRKLGNTGYLASSKYVIETTEPRALLENAVKDLHSSDWEKKMRGISEVVELSKHHQAYLLPELHQMNLALLSEVRNLRSQVSRAAIQAFATLFENCCKAMEPDVDKIGHVLLHKSGDTNKFIREDAHSTLVAMVNNMSAPRAITCIVNEGISHKNAVVRAEAGRLLVRIVEQLGGAKSLSGAKDVTEKLLPAAAQLLQEGSQEARTNAKKMFAILVNEPVFDKALHKYVPLSVVRNIQRTLDSIKKNGLNATMPVPVTRSLMNARRLDGTFY